MEMLEGDLLKRYQAVIGNFPAYQIADEVCNCLERQVCDFEEAYPEFVATYPSWLESYGAGES